jgi:trehalose 6-phosphate phosphatase
VYIGNHGMEEWAGGAVRIMPSVSAHRGALAAAIREVQGVMVAGMQLEDKGATLSLHYRRTSNPEEVAREYRRVFQAIAEGHGLRLTQGRRVFEFRPPVEINKGTAFEGLVQAHHLEAAFYLGDDTTDVAVFQAAARIRRSGRCLAYGLGVRSPGTPAVVLSEADFLVDGVAGVESFLAWLLKARMASST